MEHSQAQPGQDSAHHARGTNNDFYHILIEDDGIGINKKVYGSPGEHVGLTIMRERASKIGGDLRIESEPGEGTRVMLEIRNQNGRR